jgi:ADP-ribosylglycohydrolase
MDFTAEKGQITDDTEMMLALCYAIIRSPKAYDKYITVEEYQSWANSGGKMMGKNTRALLRGVKTLKGFLNRYKNICGFEYGTSAPSEVLANLSQSNGSLMRIAPLIVLFKADFGAFRDIIKQDCEITNPHPVNIEVNTLYFLSMICLSRGLTPIQSVEHVMQYATFSDVKQALQEAHNVLSGATYIRDMRKPKKGWCVHGLYCALACLNKPTISEALDWVIMSHPGSDTDTNACIAGAMYGYYRGYESFDQRARSNFEIVRNCTTLNGQDIRPTKYTLKDFDAIVTSLEAIVADM